MKSPAYREIFPTRIERGQDRALEFATTAGGWLYGVSMAGRGVTGRGADLIIIDDPIAVKDAGNVRKLEEGIHFFDSELRPRFDHPSRKKSLMSAIDWPKRTFRPTSMIKATGNALHCRW